MAEPDFYKRCVAAAFNIPIEQVTPAQRQRAKLACFASLYRHAPTRTEDELFKECTAIVQLAEALMQEHV